jgi:hypothetical protein
MRALWVTPLVELALGSHIRTAARTYQVGFTVFAGIKSNLLLEFLALKHGLLLVWDRGYKKVL